MSYIPPELPLVVHTEYAEISYQASLYGYSFHSVFLVSSKTNLRGLEFRLWLLLLFFGVG